MAKNRALKVGIEDGEVVIRIGVNTLRVAAEGSEDFHGAEGPRYVRVFDPDRFAAGIVEELNDEAEDGTTHVHEMFDKAFRKAIDNGVALGCEIVGEGDFNALMKKHPGKGLPVLLRLMLADDRREAKAKAIRRDVSVSGPDTKRIADETQATIKASVRELVKLFEGKAAFLSIRTKYDKTIVFDVPIGNDLASLVSCAIDTHESLGALLKDVMQRVERHEAKEPGGG